MSQYNFSCDIMWIILIISIMSLTLALSEREQNLLTHANFTELVF